MKLHFEKSEVRALKRALSTIDPAIDMEDCKETIKDNKLVVLHFHNDGGVSISLRNGLFVDLCDASVQHLGMFYSLGKAMAHAFISMAESISRVIEKHKEESEDDPAF